jgi:hypothetical protein
MDKKFIVTYKTGESVSDKFKSYSIFLFDQHAAHERVSLEHILKSSLPVFDINIR